MKKKMILLAGFFCFLFLTTVLTPNNGNFKVKKIGERIFILTDPLEGVSQLAIATQRGIVVLDSFWSEITANKFKKGWIKALKRKDFIYNINTVDRIDIFGGNAAYKDTTIIGHRIFLKKFNKQTVDPEIKRLIEMWRWKEDVSRKRLPTHKSGSKEEEVEKKWMNTCKRRADELEAGFSLVLPTMVYKDRMTLNLGDVTLKLIYFGKAGYDGLTLVLIPEERLAIIPGFIIHPHHLAPHPYPSYTQLDVPRWIEVLEEILEGKDAVKRVMVDTRIWTTKRALTHLVYIKKLWQRVKKLESEGKDLKEIQILCSLDKDFAFVKEMQVYKDGGDDWVRPQHKSHVTSYFLQHKNLASEMIKNESKNSSIKAAIAKVLKLRSKGFDLYFDQGSINRLGYSLLNADKKDQAIEVFKLNVKIFPESADVYNSLAEAYMQKGDTSLAIKNYNLSLRLNPKNDNAKKMLKKLEK